MDIVTKRCTYCGIEKSATTEYFNISKKNEDGLQHRCKECNCVYGVKCVPDLTFEILQYKNNATLTTCTKHEIEKSTTRICPKCGIEKSATIEFFYTDKRRKDGLRSWCKECCYVYKVKCRSNSVYREKEYARDRARCKTERGKTRKRLNKQRRRARKLALPNAFTANDWQQCLSYWDNKCAYCGSSDRLVMDHFISLTSRDEQCPGTVVENIVPACQHCNSSKHNKSPYIWATQEALGRIETYLTSLTCLEETNIENSLIYPLTESQSCGNVIL